MSRSARSRPRTITLAATRLRRLLRSVRGGRTGRRYFMAGTPQLAASSGPLLSLVLAHTTTGGCLALSRPASREITTRTTQQVRRHHESSVQRPERAVRPFPSAVLFQHPPSVDYLTETWCRSQRRRTYRRLWRWLTRELGAHNSGRRTLFQPTPNRYVLPTLPKSSRRAWYGPRYTTLVT